MKSSNISTRSTNRSIMKVIPQLILFALLIATTHLKANAGTTNISCKNLDSNAECEITGDGGFSESLAKLATDAINSNTSAGSLCSDVNGGVICKLGQQELAPVLSCNKQNSGLSCQLKGLDPELLKINCTKDNDSTGSCILSTSERAAENELKKIAGLPKSQISFGATLIAACASRTATEALQNGCDTILSALSSGTVEDKEKIAATLKAVTPSNFDAGIDTGRQAVYAQIKTLSNRLKALRANQSGENNVAQLQFFDGNQWVNTGDLLASNSGTMNDSSPENALLDNSRLGFFINGVFMNSEQGSSENEGGSEFSSQMMTLGIDYRFNSNFVGGFAFTYSTGESDFANDKGDLSSSGVNFMAYGSYFVDAWYLDATIMRGGTNYDQTRKLVCDTSCVTAFNQKATAEYYSATTGFTVSTGYDFNFNALSVTPFAQLASTKINLDAYREKMSNPGSAGSEYALDMGEQSRSMLIFSLGSQLRYVWAQNWGVVVPHLDLELVKELDDDENVASGNFVGNVATTQDFKLKTNQVDTSYFFIGFGFSAQLQNGNSGFFNIRTLQGYNNLDQTIYSLGWRWEI